MGRAITRRHALKWMGGLAAGVILSPAPFALIDDLTIRTQTHGRRASMPRGLRGRLRTRCAGCPRACAIDALTVEGRPWLCVPPTGVTSCALLPAIHLLALHPARLTQPSIVANGIRHASSKTAAMEAVASRIGESLHRFGPGGIGLVDLSGRPALGRPIDSLAEVLDGAHRIEAGPWCAPVDDPALRIAQPLDRIDDHSLDLLLVDAARCGGAVPWQRLRRKLVPGGGGSIVAWAVGEGAAARQADLVLPAAAPLEIDEVVGGRDTDGATTLALSLAVHPPRQESTGPLDLAQRLGGRVQRDPAVALAAALIRRGRGTIDEEVPVSDLDTASLADSLRGGAEWRDDLATTHRRPSPRVATEASASSDRRDVVTLRAIDRGALSSGEVMPPILSKLVRESSLLDREGTARAHPDTLARLGFREGGRGVVHTDRGRVELELRSDPCVPEGRIDAALGLGLGCFGDEQEPGVDVLAELDLDPERDAPDACVVREVM